MLLKRKYLFGTTILAGVMAVTAPAFAQTPAQPAAQPLTAQQEEDARRAALLWAFLQKELAPKGH